MMAPSTTTPAIFRTAASMWSGRSTVPCWSQTWGCSFAGEISDSLRSGLRHRGPESDPPARPRGRPRAGRRPTGCGYRRPALASAPRQGADMALTSLSKTAIPCPRTPRRPRSTGDSDIVVIGRPPGITTAGRLTRRGSTVFVVEAKDLAPARRRRTAESPRCRNHFSRIAEQPALLGRARALRGRRPSQAWVAGSAPHGVALQERRRTPTRTPRWTAPDRAELQAARGAGLPVEWRDEVSLPRHPRAVRLEASCSWTRWSCCSRWPPTRRARRQARRGRSRPAGPRRPPASVVTRAAPPPPATSSWPRTCRSSTGAVSSPAPSRPAPTGWRSGRRSGRSTACTSPATRPRARCATSRLGTTACCSSAATGTRWVPRLPKRGASTSCGPGPRSTSRTPSRRTSGRRRTTCRTMPCPTPVRCCPAPTTSGWPAATPSGA